MLLSEKEKVALNDSQLLCFFAMINKLKLDQSLRLPEDSGPEYQNLKIVYSHEV